MPVSEDHLVWIDLEMTGLDPQHCFIMEIGSLVTNGALEVLAQGPNLIIHNSEEQLESLSQWCKDHFGPSGMLDLVRASTIGVAEAEQRTLDFLRQWVVPSHSPLCGNSVHNDRAFLVRHMQTLHDFMHYRNIDVSTVKELVKRWYPGRVNPPPKGAGHRALVDIRESVIELRYYRNTFFVPPSSEGTSS